MRFASPIGRGLRPLRRGGSYGSKIAAKSLSGRHATSPSRPPGRQTRPSSRATAQWSEAKMAPTAELTASKLAVAYGSAWQSPTSKAIRTPCTADSRRAVRIMPGARSWAVTVAPRAAASSATRPVPVATSSQRSPGCGSSAETRCSCIAGMPVAISKTRSYASPSRSSRPPTSRRYRPVCVLAADEHPERVAEREVGREGVVDDGVDDRAGRMTDSVGET